MQFSIIICGYNEAKHLDECLSSCLNLNYPKNSFEIIYVDNNSTDKSLSIASKHEVIVLRESKQGPSEARNKGISVAKGNILLFLDADTKIDSEYLKVCELVFNDSNIGAVTGRTLPMKYTWISDYLGVSLFEGYPRFKKKKYLRACPTCNIAVRSLVVSKVGGFLEGLKHIDGMTRVGEDKEFCERIQNEGLKILYNQDMVIVHDTTHEFLRLLKTWFKGSTGRAGMIERGMSDPFSLLFKYNIPLAYTLTCFVFIFKDIKGFLLLFLLAIIIQFVLCVRSYQDIGMFFQSFVVKPWMDMLSAIVINIGVIYYRVKS